MPGSRKEYVDIDKTISSLMGRKNLLAKIARIYIRDYQSQMDQLQII
ncbi:hypothetical protein [Halarsenatibacter silvermanii]|uniref:Uncharacterized protein n=1 Tax=Halarsenatibacter silvermanii TaxID=321763 RepID=A0A1G9IRU8_9FIRM|nr:hypothetical protein [Halarsenatibacter silvermanii]SDL27594.1 hypothetical protein SAMN04488692_10340 [Halarsenatibacter silvermanii]